MVVNNWIARIVAGLHELARTIVSLGWGQDIKSIGMSIAPNGRSGR